MLCLTDVDIEVNYTDDVGQTLLNWASAFGTQEMVRNVNSLFLSCTRTNSLITAVLIHTYVVMV